MQSITQRLSASLIVWFYMQVKLFQQTQFYTNAGVVIPLAVSEGRVGHRIMGIFYEKKEAKAEYHLYN